MRTQLFIATSFAVVGLATTTGCLMDGADPVGGRAGNVDSSYRPILGATDGRVTGAIGPLSGIDADASELSTYDDGYYVSLETVVTLDDHAAMTLLSVSNGAQIFRPGVDATFRLEDNEPGMRLTMLGCVGQSAGVYDEYDAPADEVDVVVTSPEGADDQLDVALQGRWYDRDATGDRLETFHRADTTLSLLR